MSTPAQGRQRVVGSFRHQPWWFWLMWAVALSLLVSRLLQFGGTPSRNVAIWQALLPWQFLAVMFFIAWAGVRRRWGTMVALCVGWLSLLPLMASWQLHGDRMQPGAQPTFTIVAANVLYSNVEIDGALDRIAAQNADVVVLSEMTRLTDEVEAHPMAEFYPYVSLDPYATGLVILSRYPIQMEGPGTWASGESQAIVLDMDDRSVRLVAAHPPPPVFNTDIWNSELDAIGADVAAFDAPTVVAGDLNAGWVLPPFRQMLAAADLTDAMAAAGHPWTMTWPNEPLPRFPFVTLDHVLVNEGLGSSMRVRSTFPALTTRRSTQNSSSLTSETVKLTQGS